MRLLWFSLLVALTVGCGDDRPAFISVLTPSDTTDTVGPYRVEAQVVAPNGVYRLLLRLRQAPTSGVFADIRLQAIDEQHDGGTYFAELPGRPAGTLFEYYLLLIDGAGKGGGELVNYPAGAPGELLSFSIVAR
jgi:hypothetical protein